MTFLLSEQRLKTDFLNDNVDSALVLSAIQTAQDIYLRQTLGDSLFETICELVENNSVVEPYKTLLDDYIIVYLEYLAMSELCVTSTFKLGNIGVAQAYDNNVNTQSIQNVKYLESFYKQKASTYENRLVTYIQQNINYYPEYLDTNTVTTAKESTLQTGIYLGGTKTKTTSKGTSTNKNSLVGAVRYDKQQNLSEQEKQQARDNIGVSANGEINVDLENYYTKDEVNELIDNVDVDLSEYYTKDEVYNKNQVDTKLVPYITTNEVNLRLDSYYDKQEVDEKIANVSSGGTIDLSNYYTKEETYSKEEVNDLVANSGGGSSDYNTLENRPTTNIANWNYDQITNLYDFVEMYGSVSDELSFNGLYLNDLEVFCCVGDGNGNDDVNRLEFWNRKYGIPYKIVIIIDYLNHVWWWYRNELDYTERLLSESQIQEIYYSKSEIDDLLANSGGGGSDTPSNIIDILSLNYEEQIELINYVIDNNKFPNINTLYTYRGYVLNNLTIYTDWWDEALNQRYVVFSLYAHPKSLDIRFITYDNGWGEIYNDIYEKGDDEKLVTKGELFGLSYNNLNDKPIVDLLSLPNNEQVNEIDFYSDIFQFISNRIFTIEGVILNGNKCVYETIGTNDFGMPIKQVDFHINRTTNSFIIRFITRFSDDMNENIPYEFIYTNENGDTLDTLNLVTKSEIDLQFAEINATLGDINNLLEQI